MTLLRWIFSLAVLVIWCSLIGTGLYIAMYEAPEEMPKAQAIVVLGGNAPENGELTGESAARLAHGIDLFNSDAAPLLVLTGGGEPPVAPALRAAALEAGVPDSAILSETNSHSTLQNAVFTGDFSELDKAEPIILVSQRYHLPRAWASFRWAGFTSVELSAADAADGLQLDSRLLWEAVKWPLNAFRAAAASAAIAADLPREKYLKYLE